MSSSCSPCTFAYATVDPRQQLDLYLPDASLAGLLPLVIFMHGGSWRWGRRSQVPPEVLATTPTYLDYVSGSVDQGTGEACKLSGDCCMGYANQRAGSWESCPGGCANSNDAGNIFAHLGAQPRTDVEGCCWCTCTALPPVTRRLYAH